MTKLKKKLPPFARGVLIYVCVFVAIALAALIVLHSFLAAYERSRPQSFLNNYLSSLSEASLPDCCEELLLTLDENIASAEESRAFMYSIIKDSRPVKTSGSSSSGEIEYSFVAEDKILGSLTMTHSGKKSFDFETWQLEDISLDFSPWINTSVVSVPADYTVYVNDFLLDESYRTDEHVKYQALGQNYENYDSLPYMTRLESGSYLGDAELKILDSNMNELSISELSETRFLSNCSAELEEQLSGFAREYINCYSAFAANVYYFEARNAYLALLNPESAIYERMSQSFMGFGFSGLISSALKDSSINLCSDLGNNLYLVDASFTLTVTALQGPVDVDNDLRLLIIDDGEQYLVDAVYNY